MGDNVLLDFGKLSFGNIANNISKSSNSCNNTSDSPNINPVENVLSIINRHVYINGKRYFLKESLK